jgi:hypothetical protein
MGTVHDLLERQGKKGAIEAGLGRKTGDYLFGLPNRRSLSTFCCALMAAATFRIRWVVIAASDS